MTDPHLDPFADHDAAYAMGALDPAGAAAFERHLARCAACRQRVAQARETVALLAGVPALSSVELPGTMASKSLPPDTLLPGLIRRVRRERRRRTALTAAIAGLAAACLVTLGLVVWTGLRSGRAPAPAGRAIAFTAVRKIPVEATALLTEQDWGTKIEVHCTYEGASARTTTGARSTGVRPYRLVVIERNGTVEDAGSWQVDGGKSTVYTGGTAVRRERIAKIQITLADGTPILQLLL